MEMRSSDETGATPPFMPSRTPSAGRSSSTSVSAEPFALEKPFAEQYKLQRRIGVGHFAKVYWCIEKLTGKAYAVKLFDQFANQVASRLDTCSYSCPYREASILIGLEHPNIVKVRDVLADDWTTYLILELALGGTLYDRLTTTGKLREKEARVVFKQLCEGLSYVVGAQESFHEQLSS